VIQDHDGAGLMLDKIRRRFPWLELIWADGGYNAVLLIALTTSHGCRSFPIEGRGRLVHLNCSLPIRSGSYSPLC
jgi:hypothetical protein